MSKPTYWRGLLSEEEVLKRTWDRPSSQILCGVLVESVSGGLEGGYPVPVAMSATRWTRSLGMEGWIWSGGPKVLMKLC